MTGSQRMAELYRAGNLEAAEIIAADPERFPRVMQEWAAMVLNRPACVKKGNNAHAVQKMKVGPSEPFCRRRLQTAMSCCGQKPW